MSPKRSRHVEGRLGVYKQLSDVPDRHRLHHYDRTYARQDVWTEFRETYLEPRDHAVQPRARRARERWTNHMAIRGRHYALATPEDAEMWARELLEEYSLRYGIEGYWSQIERFYRWLLWHTEHPHLYNPLLLAAANYDAAGVLWNAKIKRPWE